MTANDFTCWTEDFGNSYGETRIDELMPLTIEDIPFEMKKKLMYSHIPALLGKILGNIDKISASSYSLDGSSFSFYDESGKKITVFLEKNENILSIDDELVHRRWEYNCEDENIILSPASLLIKRLKASIFRSYKSDRAVIRISNGKYSINIDLSGIGEEKKKYMLENEGIIIRSLMVIKSGLPFVSVLDIIKLLREQAGIDLNESSINILIKRNSTNDIIENIEVKDGEIKYYDTYQEYKDIGENISITSNNSVVVSTGKYMLFHGDMSILEAHNPKLFRSVCRLKEKANDVCFGYIKQKKRNN